VQIQGSSFGLGSFCVRLRNILECRFTEKVLKVDSGKPIAISIIAVGQWQFVNDAIELLNNPPLALFTPQTKTV
jgi:hypothetical protein